MYVPVSGTTNLRQPRSPPPPAAVASAGSRFGRYGLALQKVALSLLPTMSYTTYVRGVVNDKCDSGRAGGRGAGGAHSKSTVDSTTVRSACGAAKKSLSQAAGPAGQAPPPPGPARSPLAWSSASSQPVFACTRTLMGGTVSGLTRSRTQKLRALLPANGCGWPGPPQPNLLVVRAMGRVRMHVCIY